MNNDDKHTSILEQMGPFNSQMFAQSKCWGMQPLLIRSAFDPNQLQPQSNNHHDDSNEILYPWLSKEQLCILACDEDAESRFVQIFFKNEITTKKSIVPNG